MSKYWLTLEEWRHDGQLKSLAQDEFLSNPLDERQQGWQRREFLKLMGASIALSSLSCIRRPSETIIPYVKRPEEVIPGLSNYYCSSFSDGLESFSLLVKTKEGRPLKIEGNPDSPLHKGSVSARAQAHILSLYDPDRLKGPRRNLFNSSRSNKDTIRTSYEEADEMIVKALKEKKVALLTGTNLSPSLKYLTKQFCRKRDVKHFQWDTFDYSDVKKSQALCYGGRKILPRYHIEKARMIVSVGADFLGTYLAPVEMTRKFSYTRTPHSSMSQLIVFESLMSLTGTNSDVRKRVSPSDYLTVLMRLAYELVVVEGLGDVKGYFRKALEAYSQRDLGFSKEFWSQTAKNLWKHRGRSLVLASLDGSFKDALSLQIMANFLNSLLQNDGSIVDYEDTYRGALGETSHLLELTKALDEGSVETVIIYGLNLLYKAPYFKEALKKAKLVIYHGDRIDETGQLSDYILPHPHSMEYWSDEESVKELFHIQQPTIRPLYQTRPFQESLLSWAQKISSQKGFLASRDHYSFLRSYWRWGIYERYKSFIKKDFNDFWYDVLQKGFFDARKPKKLEKRKFRNYVLKQVLKEPSSYEGYELVLYPTIGLRDGSLANVSWLQEFPDPITKICWDNYLCLSPQEARKRQLREGQVVELKSGSHIVKVPIHIQPGQADGVLGLALGYGREFAGELASHVGVNAFEFMNLNNYKKVLSASFKVTEKHVPLANVQSHHSMEGRQIVVESTLKDFMKNPKNGRHDHKTFSLWKDHDYKGKKWAMAIDLNTCTGCSACVVACQSENNVPVVGKKYVLEGREMHWLRIDRYYKGSSEDPDTVFMPILCQHCDKAPCETVCPVAATVHSDEGTNDMIYNRCVGTRYCSNNCPYKVRRFNWFNYSKQNHKSPLNKQLNPEVTVRHRGVMEKCTFCIHRIKEKKALASQEGRALKDGEIQTACQQSCPTQAIVFGDMNDPKSRVSQLFKKESSYSLLEELNTQPSVRFQTKVRHVDKLKSKDRKEHH